MAEPDLPQTHEPLFTTGKKPRKPTASKPSDIRAFSLTIPHLKAGPPSSSQPLQSPLSLSLAFDVTLYLDLTDVPNVQAHYYLILPEESELDPHLDPVFLKISADVPPTDSDDKSQLSHTFWFDTGVQDSKEILKQLLDLQIIEVVDPPQIREPLDHSFPLVRVAIPDKEMAKRCSNCGIWEQRTDQQRLAVCSRCKLSW